MKNSTCFLLPFFLIGVLILVMSCKTASADQSSQTNTKVQINLRLPEEKIRAEILGYTPVGSSVDEVLIFVKKRLENKEKVEPFQEKKHGVYDRHTKKSVGKSEIQVWIGTYGFNPLKRTDVFVSWAFDENDKLIDIIVEKEIDGL